VPAPLAEAQCSRGAGASRRCGQRCRGAPLPHQRAAARLPPPLLLAGAAGGGRGLRGGALALLHGSGRGVQLGLGPLRQPGQRGLQRQVGGAGHCAGRGRGQAACGQGCFGRGMQLAASGALERLSRRPLPPPLPPPPLPPTPGPHPTSSATGTCPPGCLAWRASQWRPWPADGGTALWWTVAGGHSRAAGPSTGSWATGTATTRW
jgi:hypothetical protein